MNSILSQTLLLSLALTLDCLTTQADPQILETSELASIDFPMDAPPLTFVGDQPKIPASESCIAQGKEKTYQLGFERGFGGHHEIEGIFLDFDQLAGTRIRTGTPDRNACPNTGNPKPDQLSIHCCKKGFLAGLRELYQSISPQSDTIPSELASCREQFQYARKIADQACPAPNDPNAGTCHLPPREMSHSSCIQLGFISRLNEILNAPGFSPDPTSPCANFVSSAPELRMIANSLQRKTQPTESSPLTGESSDSGSTSKTRSPAAIRAGEAQ